jgi:hypothetical protein
VRRRLAQHRVQRGDSRNAQRAHEVQNVFAVVTAPDPVLVLDGDDVDAAVQGLGDAQVVGALVLADPVMDLEWVGRGLAVRVQDRDLTIAGGRSQVPGERRDAAAAGRVRGKKGGSNDDGSPRGSQCERPAGPRSLDRAPACLSWLATRGEAGRRNAMPT